MKIPLNLTFFLLTLFLSGGESLSITNYQIKKICKKEKMKSNCIKNMKEKRSNLQKGNFIEIPVIPYKR